MNQSSNKAKKEKNFTLRKWFKEIKRIKWPSSKSAIINFLLTIVFFAIASIIFFIMGTTFVTFWQNLGVGIG